MIATSQGTNELKSAVVAYHNGVVGFNAIVETLSRIADSSNQIELKQEILAAQQNNELSIEEATELTTTLVDIQLSRGRITLAETDPPDPDLRQATVLRERFILESFVAKGGMGTVYKARDLRKVETHDRHPHVAIKVLAEKYRDVPALLIGMQREAKKAQTLSHPNIVNVWDFDRDGQTVFITMEWLEGQPLAKLLKNTDTDPLSREKKRQYIEGIARGLAYAHQKNIVHADLKPANIFITADDEVKLLDFGVARAIKHSDQQDFSTVFDPGNLFAMTPAYASCEMLDGEPADTRDDIYGFACMIYEILTGEHPFDKLPATVARNQKLSLPFHKALTRKQWQAIAKGMAFERSRRTPTVDQLMNELYGESRRQRFWWTFAAAIALLVAILGGWYGSGTRTIGIPEAPTEKPAGETLKASAEARIAELLERAKTQEAAGRLTAPPSDNALETYWAVLDLAPGYAPALAGLVKLAEDAMRNAQRLADVGDWSGALQFIEQGLQVDPGHPGLKELGAQVQAKRQVEVQQREAEAKRVSRVAELLEQAESQEEAERFTEPPGDNALETYQVLLELDSGNNQALAGLQRLAETQAQIARRQANAGNWSDALKSIAQGLRVSPEHSGLQALQTKVQKEQQAEANRRDAAVRRKQQVAKLVAQAEAQEKADRLTRPVGGNALETYQAVLKIDPANSQARAGLRRLAAGAEQNARRRATSGDWAAALRFIEQGLLMDPGHRKLKALQMQIQAKQEAEQQHQEAAARRRLRITELLKRAEQQEAAKQVTEPAGNNALESYREVLLLDSGNDRAQAQISTISNGFSLRAAAHFHNGQWDECMQVAREGLSYFPANRKLAELLRQAMEEQSRPPPQEKENSNRFFSTF